MLEKVIWQPEFFSGFDFGISLDYSFAREMIISKFSPAKRDKINGLGNEELKRFKVFWKNPYLFHEDTCFLSQVYIGENGKWLSTDYRTIENLLGKEQQSEPIKFHSHNMDNYKEAYVLMKLFNQWVHYSDILIKP